MKKFTPYILATIAFVALLILLINTKGKFLRKIDDRITLRYKDKIPYGFYTAYTLLPQLFPSATISTDKRPPGYWDSLSLTAPNQAVFLIGKEIDPDRNELDRILQFVKEGNHVFVMCRSLSYDTKNYFGISEFYDTDEEEGLFKKGDSLHVQLSLPRFHEKRHYIYPGQRYASALIGLDTARTLILGKNRGGKPNFIQLKKGSGYMYVHVAPLAFSNYFLLHKNNIGYFQQALSVIPASIQKIVWNEYYLSAHRQPAEKEPSWLGVLFRYPAFKWALLTAIFTILIFVLLEMRRRQRIIPPLQKPTNDSLDFVKTIGRLYYDKQDHKDLAGKMSGYFLEHVRNRYKIATQTLDDDFVQAVHAKSGYETEPLKKITTFIYFVQTNSQVNEHQLNTFYHQLESFYQNT